MPGAPRESAWVYENITAALRAPGQARRPTLLAFEVGGVVGAARALIHGMLRIGAERPCPPGPRRGHPVRRFAALHPVLQGGNHIESKRAFAAAAVSHPRHHEKAIAFADRRVAQRLRNTLVVIHAEARRNQRIAPPVVLDQLAAPIE